MKKKQIVGAALLALVSAGAGFGAANLTQVQHVAGSHAGHSSTTAPKEAGQSAFAATAEIVALLSNDPNTDWSRVDISALREHLVDMNALFLQAEVSTSPLPDGWRFQITGHGQTLRAVQAMVPAHAMELDKMAEWSAAASTTPKGAELRVTSPTGAIQQKIKGLGFFGLMAMGAHHQPHHFAMATGKPMHH